MLLRNGPLGVVESVRTAILMELVRNRVALVSSHHAVVRGRASLVWGLIIYKAPKGLHVLLLLLTFSGIGIDVLDLQS